MSDLNKTVLVVGATGSIGRHVVDVALETGYTVRALVRDPAKARQFSKEVQMISGDVIRPETLAGTVKAVDAIVFTLGSDGQGKVGAETIDYGGVRNVLMALGSKEVRIALMTAIGVTDRAGSYNQSTEAHDWKRRSERLVRANECLTPSWALDGSTTTAPMNTSLYSCKGTKGTLARPKMASLHGVKSLKCSCKASPHQRYAKDS